MLVREKVDAETTHVVAETMTPPNHPDVFAHRHIGPDAAEARTMLEVIGHESMEEFIDAVVPANIRQGSPPNLPQALSEVEALARLRKIAEQNQPTRSFLGMGYHDCIVPAVIHRNLLENPGWYTQYTPYQSEISQGRLEALLNFQTMVCDLTGLEIANASLLDEATACAEAMTMCHALKGNSRRNVFLAAPDCHPQNLEVLHTRAKPLGIEVRAGEPAFDETVFGVLLQYPATDGAVTDPSTVIAAAHEAGAMVVMATDLLALTLLKPPGELEADVAVGSAQRFGLPLGYGGPHAAFFATRNKFKRQIPGRIVGVSKDSQEKPALRLSIQTREQHIRRDKATSNICTAQALLASMAGMYACYHGPEGLRQIAGRVHGLARLLAAGLERLGHKVQHESFFDTLRMEHSSQSAADMVKIAEAYRINLRALDDRNVSVALDETTTEADVAELLQVFNEGRDVPFGLADLAASEALPTQLRRESTFLTHEVFLKHRSETELMRYLKRLESRDLSLAHSMIPLGSCTMKLNAAAEMMPISWPQFTGLHPFVPLKQARGYQLLFADLEKWLGEITGFAGISLQPNAGSQGEYAGLLVIRAYHESRGEAGRDVCLIPMSAHGTNPASAVMSGLRVVPVKCNGGGDIDLADLRAKATEHTDALAAMMITYPSTHGVFEESIGEICETVHAAGGQVYLDGANLNAMVGLARPGELGADVCHINLHKTFCIPHGGGGPGMGPIGVAEHLVDFLPDHPVVNLGGENPIGPVSAAPWGSASILPISWMYITMMGAEGLRAATEHAILNANYIAHRLKTHYPVLYKGANGLVAHECILDLRQFEKVTVEDVAKRLMDFGFHAPTISWPVTGTMMVEPTESESKEELDRFCDAMIAIRAEIEAVESSTVDAADNVLKNAPHTTDMVAADEWTHSYSREQSAFPAAWLRDFKFWPAVGRIDNVWGDRNLACSCTGMGALGDDQQPV
jgi:glycine dehydrogenase